MPLPQRKIAVNSRCGTFYSRWYKLTRPRSFQLCSSFSRLLWLLGVFCHALDKIISSSVYPSDLDVSDTSRINVTWHPIEFCALPTLPSEEKKGRSLPSFLSGRNHPCIRARRLSAGISPR